MANQEMQKQKPHAIVMIIISGSKSVKFAQKIHIFANFSL